MKLSHSKLIMISGLIWFGVGFYLLQLGLDLLVKSAELYAAGGYHPLMNVIVPYLGDAQTAIMAIMMVALVIGYFKGRYVLGKSARKGVDRIRSFPNPAPLKGIYEPKYYILLGGMMLLGISIKFFGVSNDVRGLIDTAVGAALLNGAMIYFRLAREARTA